MWREAFHEWNSMHFTIVGSIEKVSIIARGRFVPIDVSLKARKALVAN